MSPLLSSSKLLLLTGQILAQVKQVVKVGQVVVGFSRNISGLFKHAITVGKRVRTETNIAAGAVSVNSAAVELALMKLPASSHATARMLVIGASKMGKLVIKHLVAKGCTKMVVVNRTEKRVASIREELHGPETGDLRLFVDISVPQNVSSCVADVDGAQLYNVDDLKEVASANKEDRLRKAMEARSGNYH
ncbi:hypothetical protein C1H46_004543 [Malus baccata]|uniref:Quinate/shikimate 5-dehydrogenase/glutamyl-tRNA reductase domain-containing protein n=1 Tax=Malus baccata TaxID=106549 RepID=A0A540NFG5_MALBA|nr:hypothetical protein C1H46_004543 [Malus baccata]